MEVELTEDFWSGLYKSDQTGWDIGYASTPLVEYFNQLKDKSIKILIPGAGNGYEAEYLFSNGFKNVFVLDLSSLPLQNLLKRMPNFPKEQLIHQNFFDHKHQYDLVIEQTFFCAIAPSLRQSYADKIYELLKPNGKLVGLWFNFPENPERNGPPFTGTNSEYINYFKAFSKVDFQQAYNSIKPRQDRELFGRIVK